MAELPNPTEGILLTHFVVSEDVERSRRFWPKRRLSPRPVRESRY